MPRTLSAALQTEVANESTKIAFLVKLNLSTVYRLTDFYTDVTYNSENYEAGGSFLRVDSVQETGDLEVNELNVSFSNVSAEVRTLVQSGAFTDKEVEIYIGYFNTSDALVGAINYFTGLIRSVSVQENNTNSVLLITVASQWANWSLKKGRYYTSESQQEYSSGDLGLEYATEVKKDIAWGKN